MPDGFWFVSCVVVGLIGASEWARRLGVRGMRSPPGEPGGEPRQHARRSRARRTNRPPAGRLLVLVPTRRPDEVVAIPQWQEDPRAGPPTGAHARRSSIARGMPVKLVPAG